MKKKLLGTGIIFLVFFTGTLRAHNEYTYTWDIILYDDTVAYTTWTIHEKKIELQVTAMSGDFYFRLYSIEFVQEGKQFGVSSYSSEENAIISSDFSSGDIREGVTISGKIYQFPPWFDSSKSFKIYYYDDYLEIPQAERIPYVIPMSEDGAFLWEIDYYGETVDSAWTIYKNHIDLEITTSKGGGTFYGYNLKFVQDGIQVEATQSSPEGNEVLVEYNGDYTIMQGVTLMGRVSRFPSSFDLSKSFKIYYGNLYLEIPEGVRKETATIPTDVPYNAVSADTCEYSLDVELGCLESQWWIGQYDNKDAINFYGEVTGGSIEICYTHFSIAQDGKQITEITIWGGLGDSEAAIECKGCCIELKSGTSLSGAIYDFPDWFDITKPFTILIGSAEINLGAQPPVPTTTTTSISDIPTTTTTIPETLPDKPPAPCPSSVILEDDEESLDLLRQFRDEKLMQVETGKALVRLYYKYGDGINQTLEDNPQLKELARKTLKALIPILIQQ